MIKKIDKDGVVRYPVTHNPKTLQKQLNDFEKSAQEGKVICISDLIGSAEEIYYDNYKKNLKSMANVRNMSSSEREKIPYLKY